MMILLYRTIEANLCRLPIAMARKTNFLMFVPGSSGKLLFLDDSRTGPNYSKVNSAKMGIDRNVDSSEHENLPVTSSMSHQDVQLEGKPLNVEASTSSASYSKREMDAKSEDFSEGSPYFKQFHGRKKKIDLGSERRIGNVDSSQLENSSVSISTPFRDKGKPKSTRVKTSRQSYSEHGMSYKRLDCYEGSGSSKHGMNYKKFDSAEGAGSTNVRPFDICESRSRLREYIEDEESHNEEEQIEGRVRQEVLRPGMVLLKQYLSLTEQIEIVKTCQELGKGPGGFYQPGYKDGAKLRLQMMCLGFDWDPQTRKYEKQRHVDGCEPPHIPEAFNQVVQRAILDAHALIKEEFRLINVDNVLPAMSPDICIVNFYTTSGRLGLHQDRDESCESLCKRLPVVSFSIGDSAEFLYGDERDIDKSKTIVLDSGDVLIFGGESRHIFHGVSSIIPDSAPLTLLEQSKLRPGRLNLTFRQY